MDQQPFVWVPAFLEGTYARFFFPFSDKSAPFFQFFVGPAGALLNFFFLGGGVLDLV